MGDDEPHTDGAAMSPRSVQKLFPHDGGERAEKPFSSRHRASNEFSRLRPLRTRCPERRLPRSTRVTPRGLNPSWRVFIQSLAFTPAGVHIKTMFTGDEIVADLRELGVTDVIWVPDSLLAQWEPALEACAELRLLRVCREGEAWPLAAGLHLGGRQPLVMMQTTGLFESGDGLRNAVYDFHLPLLAILGARSWLVENSTDSARRFAEPVLQAWAIDYRIVERPQDKPLLVRHLRACRAAQKPGAVLVAEGRL